MAVLGALALPGTASAVPTVTLTFDDGKNTQVDAANILAAAGLPATYYINSSAIGGPFFMTLDKLKAIASAPVGNEIGGHGVYHNDLSKLDGNEQRRMVCDDRNWLLAQGFDVVSFAYPFSNAGTARRPPWRSAATPTRAWAGSCGPTRRPRASTDDNCSETIPPVDAFADPDAPSGAGATTTLADLQQMVLNARPDGWVPILFHDVCGRRGVWPAGHVDHRLPAVRDLAGGPQGREPGHGADRAPGDELRARRAGRAVAARRCPHATQQPAAEPGLRGAEPRPDRAVRHAGALLAGVAHPAVQLQGDVATSAGARRARWRRRAARRLSGHGGARLLAPLVALPDMGTCAVPATLGHVYRFSGWYKSTGTVAVMHLVRPRLERRVDAGGDHHAARAGGRLDALHRRPPARPGGVTAIAPGIQFTAQTTFLLDDVELVDTVQPVDVTVQGPGRVTSAPAGISCPTDCTESYPARLVRDADRHGHRQGGLHRLVRRVHGHRPLHRHADRGALGRGRVPRPGQPAGRQAQADGAPGPAPARAPSRARRRRSTARRRATSGSWRTRRSA